MAPSREAKRRKKEDRLSELHNDLLQKVMSFLPSHEAVQVSMLARRYLYQWKPVRALRVMDSTDYSSANEWNRFVNTMLLLRDPSQLDEVEIKSYHDAEDEDESFRYIEQWVRYAFLRQVKALRLCILDSDILAEEDDIVHWPLPNTLLASNTLVKLELVRVETHGLSLDFASCPLLKDLKMEFCNLHIHKITSPSVTHLSITYCEFLSEARTRISMPSLVSLQLVDCKGRTPVLESMAKLVSAFVRLRYCSDYCDKSYETGYCGDNSCKGCRGIITGNNPSILLEGLSGAAKLELTAETTVFIFRSDLRCCPVFSNLKTLLLNDWCLTVNLDALVCFLLHSPTLEKLVLQLSEVPKDLVKKVGIYGVNEQPVTMKNLTVQVKCYKRDERVDQIVEILGSRGVPLGQIEILKPPEQVTCRIDEFWPPGSLSFEQKMT